MVLQSKPVLNDTFVAKKSLSHIQVGAQNDQRWTARSLVRVCVCVCVWTHQIFFSHLSSFFHTCALVFYENWRGWGFGTSLACENVFEIRFLWLR